MWVELGWIRRFTRAAKSFLFSLVKPQQSAELSLPFICFDLSEWLFARRFSLLGKRERGPGRDNKVTVAKLHEICYDY
jgi:hypothetical protein